MSTKCQRCNNVFSRLSAHWGGLEQYLVLKAVMYYYEPLLYKKVRLLMENSADVGVRFYEYLFKCMDEDRG